MSKPKNKSKKCKYKLRGVHPSLLEALAVYETYRRVGFKPDQIYAGAVMQNICIGNVKTNEEARLVITTVRVGDKEFTAQAGPWDKTQEEFAKDWEDVANKWNTTSEDERHEVWENSLTRQHATMLLVAIQAKGISLPCTLN